MKLNIKRFDKTLDLPSGEKGAACFDFTCRKKVAIKSGKIELVPLNVAIKIPEGHVLLLFSRSSTPIKKGLILANSVGVVDPFYCGDDDEVLAMFLNITEETITVEKGDRLAQGMIIKTENIGWNEVASMNDVGHGGYHHA